MDIADIYHEFAHGDMTFREAGADNFSTTPCLAQVLETRWHSRRVEGRQRTPS
jgi:hypothetical protein